ncbi:hypothetical protein H4J57_09795 [Colwellia sp. BRX8-7]|jgi:hypothetical protein|uniref:hypothetical protein n=1 Tax=Colwellia sp. BRX8-7 TaxID=2759833 RepID=UPI0015F44507|nr:hypothetical protein [Colwellia sp. BRX8-7]MBA6337493.1 hypothetical protein [Colwellia sp. BRX8-7]
MFIIKYILVISYLMLVYHLSKSERSFNNWLFDYIEPKKKFSPLKNCGVQWLLLSFEDSGDKESLKTCLGAFENEISNNPRLKKISTRVHKKL